MKTLDQDFPLPTQSPKVSKPSGVHKKLMAARIDLQGLKLNKSGLNKFAGYNYFELGDFLPAIQNIFAESGLCGVISYHHDIATLTITDTDDGSELVITSPMSTAALKGCHEVQNLGAVQTYIRRYLWVTAMEIVEHDALDATTGKDKKESFKSETVSAWDKLDKETQEWMTSEAMAVTVMTSDGDIEGAYMHIESLQLEADDKIALWSRLDSSQRSVIKSYSAIVRAQSIDALARAWAAVPKHAQDALRSANDKRKSELTNEPEKAAE